MAEIYKKNKVTINKNKQHNINNSLYGFNFEFLNNAGNLYYKNNYELESDPTGPIPNPSNAWALNLFKNLNNTQILRFSFGNNRLNFRYIIGDIDNFTSGNYRPGRPATDPDNVIGGFIKSGNFGLEEAFELATKINENNDIPEILFVVPVDSLDLYTSALSSSADLITHAKNLVKYCNEPSPVPGTYATAAEYKSAALSYGNSHNWSFTKFTNAVNDTIPDITVNTSYIVNNNVKQYNVKFRNIQNYTHTQSYQEPYNQNITNVTDGVGNPVPAGSALWQLLAPVEISTSNQTVKAYAVNEEAPVGYFGWLRQLFTGRKEPYNIKYWELGHNIYSSNVYRTSGVVDWDKYFTLAKDMSIAMKSVVSNIPIKIGFVSDSSDATCKNKLENSTLLPYYDFITDNCLFGPSRYVDNMNINKYSNEYHVPTEIDYLALFYSPYNQTTLDTYDTWKILYDEKKQNQHSDLGWNNKMKSLYNKDSIIINYGTRYVPSSSSAQYLARVSNNKLKSALAISKQINTFIKNQICSVIYSKFNTINNTANNDWNIYSNSIDYLFNSDIAPIIDYTSNLSKSEYLNNNINYTGLFENSKRYSKYDAIRTSNSLTFDNIFICNRSHESKVCTLSQANGKVMQDDHTALVGDEVKFLYSNSSVNFNTTYVVSSKTDNDFNITTTIGSPDIIFINGEVTNAFYFVSKKCTYTSSQSWITRDNHNLVLGQKIKFKTNQTNNLLTSVTYTVTSVNATQFQVTAENASTPVVFTQSSSNNFIFSDPWEKYLPQRIIRPNYFLIKLYQNLATGKWLETSFDEQNKMEVISFLDNKTDTYKTIRIFVTNLDTNNHLKLEFNIKNIKFIQRINNTTIYTLVGRNNMESHNELCWDPEVLDPFTTKQYQTTLVNKFQYLFEPASLTVLEIDVEE